jgi:hypothetical protein
MSRAPNRGAVRCIRLGCRVRRRLIVRVRSNVLAVLLRASSHQQQRLIKRRYQGAHHASERNGMRAPVSSKRMLCRIPHSPAGPVQ